MAGFFIGSASARELDAGLRPLLNRGGCPGRLFLPVCDLNTDFIVARAHLVRACDVVPICDVKPDLLEAIAVFLIVADHFVWTNDTPEGCCVADTVAEWAAPEMNVPLTLENVSMFRSRLLQELQLRSPDEA